MSPKNKAVAFFVAISATQSLAHARLKPTGKLTPRNEESGLKTAPCGDAVIDAAKRVTLSAGETITVEWEETINHPGSFKISFAPNGTSEFVLLKEVADTQDGPVTFGDPATYHQYSTTITVPDVTCNTCVMQLIQVMTDRTPPTFYHSCADVKITGGSTTAKDDSASSTNSNTSTKTNTATDTEPDTVKDSESKPQSPKNLKVKVNGNSKLKLTAPDDALNPEPQQSMQESPTHDRESGQ